MSPVWLNATRARALTARAMLDAAAVMAPPRVRGVVAQPRHRDLARLGGPDDPRHRLHRDDRVLADARLSGQHHARPPRPAPRSPRRRPPPGSGRAFSIIESSIWVATMTGLACSRHSCTARFCTSGTCSSGKLHAEVAAGHHEPVEGVDDRVEPRHRLRLLYLRDDRDPASDLVHDLVDELDVVGRPHEGQRDEVHPEVEREPQVVSVLFGQSRHAHRDVGQRHALVVGDLAALDDQADDVDRRPPRRPRPRPCRRR